MSLGSGAPDRLRFGNSSTPGRTFTADFDDAVVSNALADYPLGDGRVLPTVPDGLGTGASLTRFSNDDATAIDATTPGRLDELPATATGDFVRQITSNATSYVELTMADQAAPSPRGVYTIVAHHSPSTAVNVGATRVVRLDATVVTIHSGDMGSSTLSYRSGPVTKPAGGWSAAEFAALKARVGYSNDIAPLPQWDQVMFEADYAPVANTPPVAPVHVSPANGSTTADTTPTLTATFDDPNPSDTGTLQFEVCSTAVAAGLDCAGAGGVQRALESSASGIVDGTSGSRTLTTVLPAGTNYWHVRAQDNNGAWGSWSASWTLTIGAPSMTVTAGPDVTMTPGMVTAGIDATATSSVTITTDNATGYTLNVTDASDVWGMRQGVVDDVPDWTGTNADPTVWPAGTPGYFGLTVLSATGGKDTARWGAGATETSFATLEYLGPKTTGSLVHQRSTYSAASDVIVTSYRVNFSTAEQVGAYTTIVTYTGVANP